MSQIAQSDMSNSIPSPDGWGNDRLTDYLESAHRNRFATFANKPDEYSKLAKIDEAFDLVHRGWVNPKGLVTSLLFLRSHAAFRASCEHAMAGQIVDSFISIRATLETAGYALHMHRNPGFEELWLRRHDDTASAKAMKSEFQISKVRESIRGADRAGEKVFSALYERSIDFGGHPNERAVTGTMTLERQDAEAHFQLLLLQGDGLPLDHALKSVAQAGVCALETLGDVFKPRFELLGIRAQMPELKKGL